MLRWEGNGDVDDTCTFSLSLLHKVRYIRVKLYRVILYSSHLIGLKWERKWKWKRKRKKEFSFLFFSFSLLLGIGCCLFTIGIVSCCSFRFIFSPVTSWVFFHFHLNNSSITEHTQTHSWKDQAKSYAPFNTHTPEPLLLASGKRKRERETRGRGKPEITHTHPNFLTSTIILSLYKVNFSTKWYVQDQMYTKVPKVK